MRDGCANPIGPSAISRHAGLSKSLVYKHFGSVDALILQAIKEKISPLPVETLARAASTQQNTLDRASAAFRDLSEGLSHEALDLLTWSLGNTDPIALAVMKAVTNYCELLAAEVTEDVAFLPTFLGKFVEYAIARQRALHEASSD